MKDRPEKERSGRAPDRLSPELDGLLRAKGRRRRLSRGEVLYARGSSPGSVYRVESGAIQLSTTSRSDREAVLGVVEPGRWFGELTLLIEAPRVHDARALADTEVVVVPARRFHEVLGDRSDYLLEFLRLVCHRYKWAIERIDATILQPLAVRLAQCLLATQEGIARDEAAGPAELRLSQEGLGQMLGASRQSVNRQLKQWESEGLLTLAYGRIRLLDTQALRAIALDGDGTGRPPG
ncbi:Crp/Fnr family transcriptional regulator [Quisquiliibacterium transsilvanicum]|uniref:CRP-like cAMP-binding protein n=1 Tax=Quisquiliibacterium transsilvanicum TaxID=1549638 RepID=A0A7W8M931_9BURK|nr:Crp/Fnr family transcriptional regulator [Quisquiliibacterium transsilvanicum]MBB5272428.1 CRP-like cAMP-binding protein [Quisquiliibacterium transsilvanicum]